MEWTDILQVAVIFGVLGFMLGYKTKGSNIGKHHVLRRLVGARRYLEFEGYLTATESKEQADHDESSATSL